LEDPEKHGIWNEANECGVMLKLFPGSRIHKKSMRGYPKKSIDIQMDTHKSNDN